MLSLLGCGTQVQCFFFYKHILRKLSVQIVTGKRERGIPNFYHLAPRYIPAAFSLNVAHI